MLTDTQTDPKPEAWMLAQVAIVLAARLNYVVYIYTLVLYICLSDFASIKSTSFKHTLNNPIYVIYVNKLQVFAHADEGFIIR